MKTQINALNIKCGGCSNSIVTKLNSMKGISETEVDVQNGKVSFVSISDDLIEDVKIKLAKMGYPESDSSLLQSANSYVSCMIGRVTEKNTQTP